MYYIYYGDEYLHDPYSETDRIFEVTISFGLNECGTINFTFNRTHSLCSNIKMRSGTNNIRVYDEETLIFEGFLYEINENLDGTFEAVGKGSLAYLGDTLVRPYTTDKAIDTRTDLLEAPKNPNSLFTWYIEQHNNHSYAEYKKFLVGTLQLNDLTEGDSIYRSSTQSPSTSNEITSKLIDSLGGYIFIDYKNNKRQINYLSQCVDINSQVIDFGVNLIDFVKTESLENTYTAIRAEGASNNNIPITLLGYSPGSSNEINFYIDGDVIYHEPSVALYGRIEYAYSNTDCSTQEGLYKSALKQLKQRVDKNVNIEVKAIDLRLLMGEEYKPLLPGNLVRVRSIPNEYDSYMFVNSVDLNLDDPSQTTYSLGLTYNNYTGILNNKIKNLNSSIDANLDKVAEINIGLINTAELAQVAKEVANEAKTTSESNSEWIEQFVPTYNSFANIVTKSIENLNDTSVETHFYAGSPRPIVSEQEVQNKPAMDWDTDSYSKHLGDLYYDTNNGYCYRWMTSNNVYYWSRITDSDVTKALADAAQAQDTADHKRRVFYSQPTPPYDAGDLWVQGETGDILVCATSKSN